MRIIYIDVYKYIILYTNIGLGRRKTHPASLLICPPVVIDPTDFRSNNGLAVPSPLPAHPPPIPDTTPAFLPMPFCRTKPAGPKR